MVFTTVKVAFSKLLVVILFNEIALSCVKNVMISMEFFRSSLSQEIYIGSRKR